MRRLAITKRVSLADVADGWTDDCFAVVTPASYAEYIDFGKLSDAGKTNAELLQYQLKFVKDHFVSGKANFLDDDGKTILDSLTAEDIDASKELADKLFAEMVGVSLDPKALATATATSPIKEPTTTL